MKRTIMSMLGALAVAAGFFMFAAPAQAEVPCTDYRMLQPLKGQSYPNDGHYFVCFETYSVTKAQQMLQKLQGLPKKATPTAPNRPWDILKAAGVTYYYFLNRTEANDYMVVTPFASLTSRCAQSGFTPSDGVIKVSVYDNCSLDHNVPPQTPSNPNLVRTISHETGHAFDYALAKLAGSGTARSAKPGYITLIESVSPAGDFARLNARPTCAVFDSVKLNNPGTTIAPGLEFDLSYSTGVANTPVCTGTTVNFSGSNVDIAKHQMPYFFNPAAGLKYSDIWAESFEILMAGVSSSDFLPLTDRVIHNEMTCSFWNVWSYFDTGAPPGPTNPAGTGGGFTSWPTGCPQPAESQLK